MGGIHKKGGEGLLATSRCACEGLACGRQLEVSAVNINAYPTENQILAFESSTRYFSIWTWGFA